MTVSRPSRSSSQLAPVADAPWQPGLHIGFIVAALALVVCYSPTYWNLAEVWAHTGTFQYAFLIFPITAALVWSRRDLLAGAVARPQPWAALVLAGGGLFWLLGVAARINLAQHVAVVAVWPVLVFLFYGPRITGRLLFPLAYLLFAIPFGNFLVTPLQTVTAHLSVFALKLTGVPVIMEGHFIDTPASAWHVAEACSGIKFFVALTAFGVLYAHLFYTSWRRRLIFVLASMVVPILANGLRVYFTILIGEYLGMHYATGTDHMIFGWQFFGLVLLLLFLAGWPWHERPAALPPADRITTGATRARAIRVSVVALVLIVWPAAWLATADAVAGQARPAPGPTLPDHLAGQTALPGEAASASRLPGVAEHTSRRYGSGAAAIRVDYLVPTAGTGVADLRWRLFDPAAWQRVTGPSEISTPRGQRLVATTLAAGTDRRRLLYVFRLDGGWTTSSRAVRWAEIRARLTGHRLASGLLVLSGPAGQQDSRLVSAAAALLTRPAEARP